MIEQAQLESIVRAAIADTDYELITCKVNPGDSLLVEIDCLAGVDVDYCSQLNHTICEQLDAHYGADADYELEVGSVSLTAPFTHRLQYEKNLGNDVEVLAKDGKKYRGQLVSVDESTFSVDIEEKVLEPGKKRPVKQMVTHTWAYDEVKYTVYDIKF